MSQRIRPTARGVGAGGLRLPATGRWRRCFRKAGVELVTMDKGRDRSRPVVLCSLDKLEDPFVGLAFKRGVGNRKQESEQQRDTHVLRLEKAEEGE